MGIFVVPRHTLLDLMQNIATASQGLCDEHGNRKLTATIDERALRGAALAALMTAVGDVVWPGDTPIRVKEARANFGIIELER